MTLAPAELAEVWQTVVERQYGLLLEMTPVALPRLDAWLRTHLRLGRYGADTFPHSLVCGGGCFVGEVLRRTVGGGRWGERGDNLYGSAWPFLLFSRGEVDHQVNVVADLVGFVWTGHGLGPTAYVAHQRADLQRLGF
jgi:hypothetical protein